MTFTLPQAVAGLLEAFAILFAQRHSWQHAQVLLVGLLCHGKRIISRILETALKETQDFEGGDWSYFISSTSTVASSRS